MSDWHVVDRARAPWRDKWNEIFFGHDAPLGKLFDVFLLTLILVSVLIVLLESVRSISDAWCGLQPHDRDAVFCKRCGTRL